MKQIWTSTVVLTVFVVLTGMIFPYLIYLIAQAVLPDQANGSLVRSGDGTVIGSRLIGQNFSLPKYFHPRPSAAGSGYDGANSSGTNLGPTSAKLINGIADDPETPDADEKYFGMKELAENYRSENGLSPGTLIPADAATRSASGLDPHISPANAKLQAKRVAAARGISVESVNKMIDAQKEPRFLGIFGEPRVNVLNLNLALDKTAGKSGN